mmetsp:Transcript_6337/g.8915  ORF Transcript_6337/g.8915 Transcript_6337/m.8915 type:complete len:225 (-) Transcript_6337:30-704(-)
MLRGTAFFEQRLSHIIPKRINMSLMQEVRDLTASGGKPIPARVIPASTAYTFPIMKAKSLDGEEVELPGFLDKKVTLIAISFRQIGQRHLPSWTTPLAQRVMSSSRAKTHTEIAQLSIIENSFISFFESWIIANLRRTQVEIDPLFHCRQFLRIADSEKQRKILGMKNSLCGYAFLLDHHARVRFTASGTATDADLDLLFDTTVNLVTEKEKEERHGVVMHKYN